MFRVLQVSLADTPKREICRIFELSFVQLRFRDIGEEKMSNKGIICYAKLVVICLAAVMLTIPLRFVLRNVVYERMGICMPWMEIFMGGDTEFSEALEHRLSKEDEEQKVWIDWAEQYPFIGAESRAAEGNVWYNRLQSGMKRYKGVVCSLEDKVEYYCEDGLFFYNDAVTLASRLEQAAGLGIWASNDVLQMNNGYLTYKEPECTDEQIGEVAEQVADFHAFLKNEGIPFLYANAGSKVCPYDRQLPPGAEEYSNENGNALLDALAERGVDAMDFREKMKTDGLDWYDSYYITDAHWKTETGLWAAEKLAEWLNEEAGTDFDLSMFQKENYRFDTFENCFLGGHGQVVTLANAQPENYTRILPDFHTQISLQIPRRSIDLTGNYEQVLFDQEQLQQILTYSDEDYMNHPGAYECVRARNDALVRIRNLNAPDHADKKLLLLQDSFSWYSTSFLACGIGAVDTIYLPAFTGSVRSYIEKTRPDAVILMYCEWNIKPIDWTTHQSTFDLR